MKKLMFLGLGLLLASCGKNFDHRSPWSKSDDSTAVSLKGNGSPSGAHYNLNIIGVPKGKSADMTGSKGHRIFVPLSGKTKILLSEGSFEVLDGNATDGSGSFQLPHPDPSGTGVLQYSVFARPLGKPGGSSTLTTCATDPVTLEEICSVSSLISERKKGKSSFSNVSKELLTITADIDGDGNLETVPLFDESLEGYLWDYDNNGLKLLQLRFYPGLTTAI